MFCDLPIRRGRDIRFGAGAVLLLACLCFTPVVAYPAAFGGQAARTPALPVPVTGKRATVLIFVTPDCPIANQYAPEIGRLYREFHAKGVAFYAVYVDPETTAAQAAAHKREFRLPCLILLDPAHRLVEYAGARVTPEVAVYTPDGKRKYRGRIDDRFPRLGQRRERVTRRDLRDALKAVLAKKAVPAPTTNAVGCFIRPLENGESGDGKR